jgi:putative CRISPR-associated protein (TIGR02619 family)
MRTIITTTGTSLLGNAAKKLKKSFADITERDLSNVFEQMGTDKACAETNSLFKIADNQDRVILLHTSTPEGEQCAQAVAKKLAKENWRNIELRQLHLEDNEIQFERKGLRELVNTLVEIITIAQREQQEVIINATGGFKAEIAYTTMVGMIFQVPVKYIYLTFERPITFPVLPVSWNTELLIEYDDFFTWLDQEPRQNQDVQQRIGYLPDKDAILALLLPPDEDGEVFLSPAGQILWSRVNQQQESAETAPEPPASDIDNPQDKISSSLLGVKHHHPKGTLQFAQKLAALPAVESIIGGNFENTTDRRIKQIGDDGIIKLLWADNNKATNLLIQTTARGQAQTMKVASQIRLLLEN